MVSFSAKISYEKVYQPLNIVQMPNKKDNGWSYYKIFDENDTYVGKFDLKKEDKHLGYLTGLEIPKEIRGKKKAVNILLNITNFLKREAQKKDINIIHFAAANNNPFNVIRLYKKLAPNAVSGLADCHTRFAVPVNNGSQKEARELLDGFELIYRNLINCSEVEMSPVVGMDIV